MAEQIEVLQIQLIELTTGQTTMSINYSVSQLQYQNTYLTAYYASETTWTPSLNKPYEIIQPQQNTWNQPRP